jgi:UDP-N-acetylmuramoyl-L-alanyl-D-glutamate--2,6-diaminopimelate ligase
MKLGTLVTAAVPASAGRVVGDAEVEIASLDYDSRKAGPGTLFFCVVGENRDGHDFAAEVIAAGAVALVVERELPVAVPQVLVPSARAAMAPFAAAFAGDPTAELRVVAVTGTNGKTTTAYLAREILEAAGVQTGLMGTVKQVVGGQEEEVERTTAEAIDLQEAFRRMVDGGDAAVAMEVSSHALVLRRADAVHFDVAVFTNLTQDHLDFHETMERYFLAKRELFDEREPRVRVVNVDDEYGRRLAAEFDCVTYSVEGAEADFIARDQIFDSQGTGFTIVEAAGEIPVRTRLQGHFNVANALAAYIAAVECGVDREEAARALATAEPPPGRFEPIDGGQDFKVIVDYAHTPDSVENVLLAARPLTEGKLISVFGAGGDRDATKRPLMGKAGGDFSDLVVVTSDNPRSEDPARIVEEVAAGAREGDAELVLEVDRREAIALAFRRARPGDTVVIAGKGHEQGQEFENKRKIPFDDRDVARDELRKLGSPA